jgi:hypothetical protein
MLAVMAEFHRIDPYPCTHDDLGNPISSNPTDFPYGATCNLSCESVLGPFSPMRAGSADNIYVIPAPEKITFRTATLLMAGCCIPAILSLIFTWIKILKNKRKKLFGGGDNDEPSKSANRANTSQMQRVNHFIRRILNIVETPLLAAATLIILTLGEMNFFSPQVYYQNEPVAAIGR